MNHEFRRFRGRLAQFKVWQNSPAAWEKRWAKSDIGTLLHSYTDGRLHEFEIFSRFLPKNQPVLEAGCGMGQLVMALSARGYEVEGIDYDVRTISRIKASFPQLNVSVGDVSTLSVPDGVYGGYISIGVVEHEPAGPIAILREARRVLAPEGLAFITVPHLNPSRQRLLRRVSVTDKTTLENGLSFYQFYFSHRDFEAILRDAGFSVIQFFPYAVYAGLTRDFKLGCWLHEHGFFSWQVQRRLTRWCQEVPNWMRWRWAHMLMYICQPLA